LDEDVNEKKRRKRDGKPNYDVASLRQIVRNPTRRRFLEECLDPDSLLWTATPSGYETMHKLLFNVAAQDPMNIIYAERPGETRSVKSAQMLKIIKWQVRKDRANYKGKRPKRQICFGAPLEFDWAAALENINSSTPIQFNPAPTTTTNPSPNPSVQENPTPSPNPSPIQSVQQKKTTTNNPAPIQSVQKKKRTSTNPPAPIQSVKIEKPTTTQPKQKKKTQRKKRFRLPVITEPVNYDGKFDLDSLRPCHDCTLAVWIGQEALAPPDTPIACPKGSDWTNPSVQPYCPACWERESQLLDGMTSEYKAIGSKRKNTLQQKSKLTKTPRKNKSKPKKTQQKGKKTKKTQQKSKSKPKKKSLGGVQGPLVIAPVTPRWKVREHNSNKQNGVFQHHYYFHNKFDSHHPFFNRSDSPLTVNSVVVFTTRS